MSRAGVNRRAAWKSKREARENRIAIWTVVITFVLGLLVVAILILRGQHGGEEHHYHEAPSRNAGESSIRVGE